MISCLSIFLMRIRGKSSDMSCYKLTIMKPGQNNMMHQIVIKDNKTKDYLKT
jgi:hypothetical protein